MRGTGEGKLEAEARVAHRARRAEIPRITSDPGTAMTERRDFLRNASLLAAGALVPTAAEAMEGDLPVQGNWDMSWVAKVTGRYRIAFDAPEVSNGVCLHQVRSFLAGYAAVHGLTDADLTAVLVIRHKAVPMIMGDATWADGWLGERTGMKDPVSGEKAKRNPFINIPAGAPHTAAWPDGALDTLIKRGVIVLGCDLALGNFAGQIAQAKSIPRADARKLVYDHLIPGVTVMPSGIFATCRAQAAGCGFMYAV